MSTRRWHHSLLTLCRAEHTRAYKSEEQLARQMQKRTYADAGTRTTSVTVGDAPRVCASRVNRSPQNLRRQGRQTHCRRDCGLCCRPLRGAFPPTDPQGCPGTRSEGLGRWRRTRFPPPQTPHQWERHTQSATLTGRQVRRLAPRQRTALIQLISLDGDVPRILTIHSGCIAGICWFAVPTAVGSVMCRQGWRGDVPNGTRHVARGRACALCASQVACVECLPSI